MVEFKEYPCQNCLILSHVKYSPCNCEVLKSMMKQRNGDYWRNHFRNCLHNKTCPYCGHKEKYYKPNMCPNCLRIYINREDLHCQPEQHIEEFF
jgi:hypothetical protein